MSEETPILIRVGRQFGSSPGRVFDAWLDPGAVAVWMRSPSVPGEFVRAEVDARVGGGFSFVDRRGDEEVDHVGEYLEIDRPRRLAFTWSVPKYSPGRDRVTLDFTPSGEGTELTLTYELAPAWAEHADRCRAGWSRLLDGVARALGEA